jgi:hypothetical protein
LRQKKGNRSSYSISSRKGVGGNILCNPELGL